MTTPERKVYIFTDVPVAGFRFRREGLEQSEIRPSEPLILRMKPTNPHDRYAVQVLWAQHHIGYVPRGTNLSVFNMLEGGLPVFAEVSDLDEEDRFRPIKMSIFQLVPAGA